ncbi:MAG: hypothetical protein KGH84_02355 [Paracoccaceae bacterium]|nr:hypothetical protein [Paracoccaceae bacterium]
MAPTSFAFFRFFRSGPSSLAELFARAIEDGRLARGTFVLAPRAGVLGEMHHVLAAGTAAPGQDRF